ncbi:uncharacterized protein LOC128851843 [Cuculus canorus]|uniref:uncharacterized protein LOC128851843 n=1 Tax=Cuculus canorus TaxID=55661 RepID=UPI0023AAA9B9|nr:uncharacterized protein LOC128851843 [Cuculus canorus]
MNSIPFMRAEGLPAQLKCIHTNARSMGNKKEELEAIVGQGDYDVVAIMETWWDNSYKWSAAIGGYKLFRRRKGRRGGGVALYVRECFDTVKLSYSEEGTECLWVKIRGAHKKADIVMGVCYRPCSQEEAADELFYKQLGIVSRSLPLALMGDFNLPDTCWKYNTAERKQSRRFLECVEDNFLTQLVPQADGHPSWLNGDGLSPGWRECCSIGPSSQGGHVKGPSTMFF